jgi:hypothetical protein
MNAVGIDEAIAAEIQPQLSIKLELVVRREFAAAALG